MDESLPRFRICLRIWAFSLESRARWSVAIPGALCISILAFGFRFYEGISFIICLKSFSPFSRRLFLLLSWGYFLDETFHPKETNSRIPSHNWVKINFNILLNFLWSFIQKVLTIPLRNSSYIFLHNYFKIFDWWLAFLMDLLIIKVV